MQEHVPNEPIISRIREIRHNDGGDEAAPTAGPNPGGAAACSGAAPPPPQSLSRSWAPNWVVQMALPARRAAPAAEAARAAVARALAALSAGPAQWPPEIGPNQITGGDDKALSGRHIPNWVTWESPQPADAPTSRPRARRRRGGHNLIRN